MQRIRLLLGALKKSLAGKLVLAISLFFLLGSSLVWFIATRNLWENLKKDAVSLIVSVSDTTRRSIRHDMLTADMEDIQFSLQALGSTESIDSVRVVNHLGIISHSSDRSERGRTLNRAVYCSACHQADALDPELLMPVRQWLIRTDEAGGRRLTLYDPIANEPDCYTAACHVHPREQPVIGMLVSETSLDHLGERVREQVVTLSGFMLLVVLVIALFLCLILWKIVLQPIQLLDEGMKKVSQGDLDHRIDLHENDELGRLAGTYNTMAGELRFARRRLEKWTESLEEEVERKTRVIRETQDKLIEAEKLAALGRLTADIAHEIRNPLTALGGFGRRLEKISTTEKQQRYAALITAEATRLENILKDILLLSWEPRFQLEKMVLTDLVEEALLLLAEHCVESKVRIEKRFDTDAPVLVEREHIKQAFLNLISNAVDAMPEGGTLSVSVEEARENLVRYVAVHVADTGPGISPEALEHIFEPFYTTKKVGQGTGLGLAFNRKVVVEHGGFIRIRNRVGGGLQASMYFPLLDERNANAMSCWEFMQCGRDKDSSIKCPAYPHFGRICWAVAGTLCAGRVQGSFAQKIQNCEQCRFFQAVQKEIPFLQPAESA